MPASLTFSAPPAQADRAPAQAGEAPMRGLIERQLSLLGRLAEAGLNIALAIERQALASETLAAGPDSKTEAPGALAPVAPAPVEPEPVAQVVRGDIALAYGRVARAVRLTVALQGRLIKDLQELDEGAARRRLKAEGDASRARQAAERARKERVERIVERLCFEEAKDEAEGDRLADEAAERLEHDDIYGDLNARPVSETIAMIARDLGLSPDWGRLAEEAWAKEELASEAVGPPLMAFRWLEAPPPDAPLEGELSAKLTEGASLKKVQRAPSASEWKPPPTSLPRTGPA